MPVLQGWRRTVVKVMQRLFRAVLYVIGYFYIPTYGKRASRDEAPIVVSNHVSFIEAIFLLSQFCASPVAAKEHVSIPIVGKIVAAMQTIRVDRFSANSRTETLDAIKSRAGDSSAPPVLIFPEGTTTNGSALIVFKAGAFSAGPGKAVQPCCVRMKCPRSAPYWVTAGPSAPLLLWRILCEPINWMEVRPSA